MPLDPHQSKICSAVPVKTSKRWLLFEITLANSRGWASLQDDAANNEIDDYKTMSKTITQSFQPQNMLKRQIIPLSIKMFNYI